MRERISSFRAKHATLWQAASFWLLGSIASVVDIGVFALCNYLIFARLADVDAVWWLFDYSVQNGGLAALISFAVSFALSQTVNFFVQRRLTFAATNNMALSGILFAITVLAVYVFVMWLPTVIAAPIYLALGASWGALAVKLICQFASFLIQFPINKWVIMRVGGKGKTK